MPRKMLIDASHPEETRIAVLNGSQLEEFDYETTTRSQLKGNIYLAKVTRVEPSLQAAFVDYGGERHGFLAFGEIHPDYYRIPVADQTVLEDSVSEPEEETATEVAPNTDQENIVEELGGEEVTEEAETISRRKVRPAHRYKIQEVIKRNQVLLVQVVKEQRGTKGAALTTYLSLAGRYCVLMPNSSQGGGISRKIADPADRKRLRSVLSELDLPKGMGVIIRTAGAERSKLEVRRDFDYIIRLWEDIRTRTLESIAPALVHEEANLIRRTLRDMYAKDMAEITVAGDVAYRAAKDFMKSLIPSHAKKVQPYKDEQGIPLFQRYQVESQLAALHDPEVRLPSGGAIVIHQTEALVAIDVNSSRANRERDIEKTAYKTNLEAATEIARQLRLRDMAGLIVIDFIDMEEAKNNGAVERRLKDSLKHDRARIRAGRISPFGLLEMSRQRLRPSLLEAMTQPCAHCGGMGYVRSVESAALDMLRSLEEEGVRHRWSQVCAVTTAEVALYLMNNKRDVLTEIERGHGFEIVIETDANLPAATFEIRQGGGAEGQGAAQSSPSVSAAEQEAESSEKSGRKRKRSRRRSKQDHGAEKDKLRTRGEGEKQGRTVAVDDRSTPKDTSSSRKRRRRRSENKGEAAPETSPEAGEEARPQSAQAGNNTAGIEKTTKPRRKGRSRRPRLTGSAAPETTASSLDNQPQPDIETWPGVDAPKNKMGKKGKPVVPGQKQKFPSSKAESQSASEIQPVERQPMDAKNMPSASIEPKLLKPESASGNSKPVTPPPSAPPGPKRTGWWNKITGV